MTDLAEQLDAYELAALARAEKTIRKGLRTFVSVGQALMEIRDRELFRATHPSFEAYLADRWRLSRRHGARLIQAAEVAAVLGPIGPVPETESQARELAPLLGQPGRLRQVWSSVFSRTSGRPTAAAVRQAVREEGPPIFTGPPSNTAPPVPPTEPDPQPESPKTGPESGGPVSPKRPPSPVPPVPDSAGRGNAEPSFVDRHYDPKLVGREGLGLPGWRAKENRADPDAKPGPRPEQVGGPLLTSAEVHSALTNPFDVHYLDELGCRLALLHVEAGDPLDLAVARACGQSWEEGRLPARIMAGAR